jgi:hypothetical protein
MGSEDGGEKKGGRLKLYTVKKGYSFSRPQPGYQ